MPAAGLTQQQQSKISLVIRHLPRGKILIRASSLTLVPSFFS